MILKKISRAAGRCNARRLASLLVAGSLAAAGPATAQVSQRSLLGGDMDLTPKPWVEADAPPPPALPRDEDLIPFEVSVRATARFLIDGRSLVRGADGVMRYVVVIRAAGGAESVLYEGIRCETLERRLYATGRADGGWSPARGSAWQPIRENSLNRYHAALARDHFCPSGAPEPDAAQVVAVLRRQAASVR